MEQQHNGIYGERSDVVFRIGGIKMSKIVYICTLTQNEQKEILDKAMEKLLDIMPKKQAETQMEIIKNCRLCDIEELIF